jgi:RecJ-like exonuclease
MMHCKELFKKAYEMASIIKKKDEILIVTHVDADGIASGSIALQALERAGIKNDIVFTKQLATSIEEVANRNMFTWFIDLGSGQLDLIAKHGVECVIIDHHVPQGSFARQLNPHDFGFDGAYELSGATATYLVARYMGLNYDLVSLAIVGAIGDLQDLKYGELVGLNKSIMNEGIENGFISAIRDIRLFGKQTRPVHKMLEYTFDPYLPGISGNEKGAIELMESLGISLKNGKWRRWIDLSFGEKVALTSELVKICIEAKQPLSTIKRLVGETYILLYEEEGTELRDAMEFSTLLNATARYGYEEIGLKVCLGDREDAYRRARTLLHNHRKNLSDGIKLVDEIGITEMENIQYFHAEDKILDTIVGIVAGMYFPKANFRKPIVAFANNEDGVKVSARATQKLVEMGVHLAKALKNAAEKVGGKGGGHSIAAGALIPTGCEKEFLAELNRIVGQQLARFEG